MSSTSSASRVTSNLSPRRIPCARYGCSPWVSEASVVTKKRTSSMMPARRTFGIATALWLAPEGISPLNRGPRTPPKSTLLNVLRVASFVGRTMTPTL